MPDWSSGLPSELQRQRGQGLLPAAARQGAVQCVVRVAGGRVRCRHAAEPLHRRPRRGPSGRRRRRSRVLDARVQEGHRPVGAPPRGRLQERGRRRVFDVDQANVTRRLTDYRRRRWTSSCTLAIKKRVQDYSNCWLKRYVHEAGHARSILLCLIGRVQDYP